MEANNNELKLKNAVIKYKFKSVNKLKQYAKRKGIDTSNALLKSILNESASKTFIRRYNKQLMGNKFSAIDGFYQMDIYFDHKKPYLLFVNVNTRFASIYPLISKSATAVLEKLALFNEQHHPNVIECDDDKSFKSHEVLIYLRSQGIMLHISLNQLHSDLCIINALSKRLNTLKAPLDSVEEAVRIYNKSPHSSLLVDGRERSPKEMENDKHLQHLYIYDQLKLRDSKRKLLLDDPIVKGDKVRYILDEDRKAKKFAKNQRKYKLSKCYYIVESVITPFSYLIIAKDGSVKRVPRYRLYKLESNDKVTQFAESIEDESNFEVYDRILEYKYNPNHKKCRYIVIAVSRDRDGNKIKRELEARPSDLRDEFPNRLSALETEFLDNNSDKWRYDADSNMIVPK